jgi:hypothetical protein
MQVQRWRLKKRNQKFQLVRSFKCSEGKTDIEEPCGLFAVLRRLLQHAGAVLLLNCRSASLRLKRERHNRRAQGKNVDICPVLTFSAGRTNSHCRIFSAMGSNSRPELPHIRSPVSMK